MICLRILTHLSDHLRILEKEVIEPNLGERLLKLSWLYTELELSIDTNCFLFVR